MNRLEETMPKIKSSSLESSASSSSQSESFVPSSPAFSTTPVDISKKSKTMSLESIFDFDFKTLIIFLLLFVMIFSYLGINLLVILGDSVERFVEFISPIITQFLSTLGYSTGSVINKTADVVSDTAKETVDIAEGAVQNVGNLLIDASNKNESNLQKSLTPDNSQKSEPQPDVPENTIQKPITSSKYNWCLVGEYQNKRGCVPVTESDKCLSGQVFPTQKMCLNPNITTH